MNGKDLFMPYGIVFQKHYCTRCGTKLEKEKTHRVVTKEDKDYYRFHGMGTYPQRDYDVYRYRFRCPSCNARVAYDEQRILRLIQKKLGENVLSAGEIKTHYEASKKKWCDTQRIMSFMVPLVLIPLSMVLCFLLATERTSDDLIRNVLVGVAFAIYEVVTAIRIYKGRCRGKYNFHYSFEKLMQLEKLHSYSANNRSLIAVSNRCYCFHCKAVLDPGEIDSYVDQGQTALCPKCTIDAVLPDGIDEKLDEEILTELHEYWF